ncbi:hypothetical protein VP01_4452g1 [Puccinia sorghi]|uniref:Uncharacterized protein n=1 Tax=Puccinia sorghi TaxID=27349 RepID=A0A0L6UPD2_9BASI|nr:hypothetical protein VP01_4452g1 [Puccinia sorghi]
MNWWERPYLAPPFPLDGGGTKQNSASQFVKYKLCEMQAKDNGTFSTSQFEGISHPLQPPADPTAFEAYKTNHSKTDKENPFKLWKLLTNHYESQPSCNHTKVFNEFITFQLKGSDLYAYLETVDKHLEFMSSKIVLKLPQNYSLTKEFLYSQKPWTVELVKRKSQEQAALQK